MVNDGWTERQVRDALTKSPESPREEPDDARKGRGDREALISQRARARPGCRRAAVLQRQGPSRQVDGGRRHQGTAPERRIQEEAQAAVRRLTADCRCHPARGHGGGRAAGPLVREPGGDPRGG